MRYLMTPPTPLPPLHELCKYLYLPDGCDSRMPLKNPVMDGGQDLPGTSVGRCDE